MSHKAWSLFSEYKQPAFRVAATAFIQLSLSAFAKGRSRSGCTWRFGRWRQGSQRWTVYPTYVLFPIAVCCCQWSGARLTANPLLSLLLFSPEALAEPLHGHRWPIGPYALSRPLTPSIVCRPSIVAPTCHVFSTLRCGKPLSFRFLHLPLLPRAGPRRTNFLSRLA